MTLVSEDDLANGETASDRAKAATRGELLSMFATPILRLRYPEPERLNPGLLDFITALRSTSPGQDRSNRNGWHSDYDFLRSANPAVESLRSFIVDGIVAAERALANGSLEADTSMSLQGWANVNPPGAYNAPHRHPGYSWSGTFYVSQPASTGHSGMIEFIDPRTDVTGWSGLSSRGGIWSTSKFRLRPEAGEMIIFPSFLLHWVYPNEALDDRVSVAFNARFNRDGQ